MAKEISFFWRRFALIVGVALASVCPAEVQMGTLNKNTMHYTKFSLYKWKGAQPRYRVNQSIRATTAENMIYLAWNYTRELREMWNSVKGNEDEDWYGFREAEQLWRDCRKEYGKSITLWVAKANHKKKYKPGEIQPNVRVPRTVGVLMWLPQDEELRQVVWMDDWKQEFEYRSNRGVYNMVTEYRNPLTLVSGGTAPGGW